MKTILKEGSEFLGARVFSFVIEELGLWILVEICLMKNILWNILGILITGTLIAKVILAFIVIVLNYFFSKFLIFKKKPQKKTTIEVIKD